MDAEGPGAEYPYFFLFFLDVSLLEIRIYKKKRSFWGKERLRSVTFEEFSQ